MSLPENLVLTILPSRLAISRLSAKEPVPPWAQQGSFSAIVRTDRELSLVCDEALVSEDITTERGWRALRIEGVLSFSMVGVLAAIAVPLAGGGISIFAVSTYDTDYILVKETLLPRATEILIQSGFKVLKDVRLSA